MLGWIKALGGLGTIWLEGKQKKQSAKDDRNAENMRQTGNWEDHMAKGSQDSWKDEYWTIIFSIPLIMGFFPNYVDVVAAGFAALDQAPDWYKNTLLVLVGASVGVRQIKSAVGAIVKSKVK